MVINIVTVKTRLALIQNGINGVKRAYAQAPASLPPSDLPAFVNFVGPATYRWATLNGPLDTRTRRFVMRLYVKPIQSGLSGEAEKACEPFFALVPEMFETKPYLEDANDEALAGVMLATLVGDKGISVLTYAGEEHAGIEFEIEVKGDF